MVTSVVDTTATATNTGLTKSTVIGSDFDTFLKLLTTQMKNQDPLNPINSTDYATQLATFSGGRAADADKPASGKPVWADEPDGHVTTGRLGRARGADRCRGLDGRRSRHGAGRNPGRGRPRGSGSQGCAGQSCGAGRY